MACDMDDVKLHAAHVQEFASAPKLKIGGGREREREMRNPKACDDDDDGDTIGDGPIFNPPPPPVMLFITTCPSTASFSQVSCVYVPIFRSPLPSRQMKPNWIVMKLPANEASRE